MEKEEKGDKEVVSKEEKEVEDEEEESQHLISFFQGPGTCTIQGTPAHMQAHTYTYAHTWAHISIVMDRDRAEDAPQWV